MSRYLIEKLRNIIISNTLVFVNSGTSSLTNRTYHSFQLDLLFEDQNKDVQEAAQLLKAGLESGVVTPLPAKVYPKTEVEQAFR
jgi:hypothetical protein